MLAALHNGITLLDELVTRLEHSVEIFEKEVCEGTRVASAAEIGKLATLVQCVGEQHTFLTDYLETLEAILNIVAIESRDRSVKL